MNDETIRRLNLEVDLLVAAARPKDAAAAKAAGSKIRDALEKCMASPNYVTELEALLVEYGICTREEAAAYVRDYASRHAEKLGGQT